METVVHSPTVAANMMICLIQQTNYPLARQLSALEQRFLAEGGMRERMYRLRKVRRDQGRR